MLSGEVGVCKSASLLERDFFQAAADVRCSLRSLRTWQHVAARVVCPQTVLKIQRPHWAATPSSSAAMPGSTVFTVFTVSATGSASASAAAMLGTRFHSCRSGRHRVSVMALSMALGTCAWELRPR